MKTDRLSSKEFSKDEFDQFLRRVKDVDEEDIDLLKNVSESQDQEAYREALKRLQPHGQLCFKCGADPWKFEPGPCQVCGGTPPKKSEGKG